MLNLGKDEQTTCCHQKNNCGASKQGHICSQLLVIWTCACIGRSRRSRPPRKRAIRNGIRDTCWPFRTTERRSSSDRHDHMANEKERCHPPVDYSKFHRFFCQDCAFLCRADILWTLALAKKGKLWKPAGVFSCLGDILVRQSCPPHFLLVR